MSANDKKHPTHSCLETHLSIVMIHQTILSQLSGSQQCVDRLQCVRESAIVLIHQQPWNYVTV